MAIDDAPAGAERGELPAHDAGRPGGTGELREAAEPEGTEIRVLRVEGRLTAEDPVVVRLRTGVARETILKDEADGRRIRNLLLTLKPKRLPR